MNKNTICVYVGDFKLVFIQSDSAKQKADISALARDLKGSFEGRHEELTVETKNLEEDFAKFCREFRVIEAGGGLIRNSQGEYLLIFRNGKWDLPKGKLDKKERPDTAAVRECREECGLKEIKLQDFLMHTYHIYPYKGNWALKKTWWYHMECDETELTPQLEENITRVEWMSPARIQGILRNTYSNIKDVLAAAGLAPQGGASDN